MQNLISWLLKGVQGVTTSDKVLLFFVKIIYLSLRLVVRTTLGKERRKRFYIEYDLDFFVCNKFFRFFQSNKNDLNLLKFKIPKYNFEFYCRKNKDDFNIMTFHEDDIIAHFTPKVGDIVVDVGAHIGPYTIIASKFVGPNGKVVAIEADPDNFHLLNRNIQLNKLTNVIALNYAAYSKEIKLKLYLPCQGAGEEEESSFTKYNTVMPNRAQSEEKFVEVEANTLDKLLESNGIKQEEVNWIKIDVEGAEYEVLKGANNILSKSKDISLLIEIHNLSGATNLYKPISEFLSLYNFKIDFEKTYDSGEKHIIAQKYQL